jgi:endonuclease/exonuclease/phosphatase family metal-dependent hydrolase
MRIVSLNAWGGAMFDPLAAWLPQCGSDVLCLQEVTRTAGRTGWTRFDDGERQLPQRANLFDDVGALLPRHQAQFVASDAGPVMPSDGHGDGIGAVWRQDFGLGLFVADHLTVVAQHAAFVHGRFTESAQWAITDRPRIAHGVRLFDRIAARFVTVVHLHGLRDPAGKHDTPARRAQAERLAELVDDVHEDGDFTVVCGDMNLLPDSETFAILGRLGLVDLVGTADTRTSAYRKPLRHANYMLVSHPDAVASFRYARHTRGIRPSGSDPRPRRTLSSHCLTAAATASTNAVTTGGAPVGDENASVDSSTAHRSRLGSTSHRVPSPPSHP